VHPWVVARAGDEEMERMVRALEEMLAGARVRPVALGEMGLDRSPRLPADGLGRQERALRAQLAMARALDLPVVLHVLRAHEAALAVLRSDGLPARGGVVHSFSGSAELARAYLKLGLHLSFAGPITYENARKTREAARAVPAERLLVETDAPDQTPRARKPGRNEPAFLAEIVEALAHARGEDPAALARSTADNARRLFGLAPG
jgi:TatD DNase family protein